MNDISGHALVVPPPSGAWSAYNLTVCEAATATCVPGVPPCVVIAGGPAACAIPGLHPGITYQVSAVAQAGGSPDSQPSNNATFTTPVP